MKKIISLSLIGLSVVSLAACGMKQENSAEKIIKETQVNVANQIKNSVFAKKQGDFDGYLKVDVQSPMGSGNFAMQYSGMTNYYTGLVNLVANLKYSLLQPMPSSGDVSVKAKFITTLKKIYFKVSKLDVNIPDPTIQPYLAMANMFIGKRLYLENSNNNQTELVLKNIDIEKELKKYALFKVNKTLSERKYQVSLSRKNIANVIVDVSKQVDPKFTGTVDEIEKSLTGVDLTGVLAIQEDKLHFSFSGYLIDGLQKTAIKLDYLPNKFKLDLPSVSFDFTKDGERYKGYIFVKDANVNIPTKVKLTSDKFALKINYKQQQVIVNLEAEYNFKENKNVKINLPENAVNLQQLMGAFGGQTLPQK